MDNAHWWIAGAAVSPGHVESAYVHRGKAASDSRFRIATLEEVVSAFPRVLLNLDIKRSEPDVAPYEQLLADEIRRLECTDSVMVASFLDTAIQTFRAMAPRVATSAATGETAAFFFSLQEGSAVVAPEVRALQVPATFADVVVVDQKFVDAAHELGVAVHVWTINAVDEMVRLLDLGVDGIISDTPTPLATLLDQRGCAWDGRM